MIKFYMYVIYRLHDFFGKKDNTPIADTVLVMTVVHFFQLATLYLYLGLFLKIKTAHVPKDLKFYLIMSSIFVLYYFIVFHNGKWKKWAKQFKKESPEERKRNGIRVWLFCWGSIILFFLSLPIFSLLQEML